MASQSSIDTIQKAYITYYGRPADQNGLEYWADQLDTAQGELSSVIDAFGTSLEFTERFSELDSETLINNIYQQAFSRDADEGGTAFYLERLESGEATLASIALQILDGAQNDDVLVLQKKIDVGDLIIAQAQESGRVYTGSAVAEAVSGILSDVTLDSASAQQHAETFDEIAGKMAYSQNSYQVETLEEGYQVREEQDLNRDGFVEIVKTSTYDDLGRLIRTDEDTDGDGSTDQIFQWQFDEFGNLSQYEVDTDVDGQADYIEISVYKGFTGLQADEDYRLAQEAYQAAQQALLEVEELYHQDEEAHREEFSATHEAYNEAWNAYRDAGQVSNQAYKDLHYTPNLNATQDEPESPLSVIPAAPRSPSFLYTDGYINDVNLVSRTIDSDGDGHADYTLNYTYDENDRLLIQQKDSDGDGLTDYSVSYQYRDSADMADDVAVSDIAIGELPIYNNAIAGWEIDNDGDGQADETATFQYNEQGWMTRYEQDSDGQLDSSINYSYDDSGRMTKIFIDSDGDGSVERSELASYNDQDIKISQETLVDYDDDNFINRRTIQKWDDEGQKTFTREDHDLNDGMDEITYRVDSDPIGYRINYELDQDQSYDSPPLEYHTDEGNLTTHKKDLDNDGTFEYVLEQESNDRNWELRQSIDLDDDGVVDDLYTVVHTEENNIIRDVYYQNGELDRLLESEYDNNGNEIRSTKDYNGDGNVDAEILKAFDEYGSLITYTEDKNGDGVIDTTVGYSYTYDDAGNKLTYAKDLDNDGIFDETVSYTYDDAGSYTSIKRETDSNDDGHIDYGRTIQYDTDGNVVLIGTYGSDDQYG